MSWYNHPDDLADDCSQCEGEEEEVISPTFDSDGYPTDETIQAVKQWPHDKWPELIQFLGEAWHWKDYINIGRKYVEFHTGGWSGNEDIMGALMDNHMIVALYWQSETRGGHYKFKRKP